MIVLGGFELDESEIEFTAIRAQGAGGQNVNKVSSAIQLRFNIHASRLPVGVRQRMLAAGDSRISRAGVLVIKAQRFRDQEKNRLDALDRLAEVIKKAAQKRKTRIATRPTKASVKRRLEGKTRRSQLKSARKPVDF